MGAMRGRRWSGDELHDVLLQEGREILTNEGFEAGSTNLTLKRVFDSEEASPSPLPVFACELAGSDPIQALWGTLVRRVCSTTEWVADGAAAQTNWTTPIGTIPSGASVDFDGEVPGGDCLVIGSPADRTGSRSDASGLHPEDERLSQWSVRRRHRPHESGVVDDPSAIDELDVPGRKGDVARDGVHGEGERAGGCRGRWRNERGDQRSRECDPSRPVGKLGDERVTFEPELRVLPTGDLDGVHRVARPGQPGGSATVDIGVVSGVGRGASGRATRRSRSARSQGKRQERHGPRPAQSSKAGPGGGPTFDDMRLPSTSTGRMFSARSGEVVMHQQ